MQGITEFELQEPFNSIGSITTAQTTPAATARSGAAIEALANCLRYQVQDGICGLELRFRSNADNNDTIVLDILAERKCNQPAKGYYTRIATLTLTVGQQTANTGYAFIDTVVVSNESFNQEIEAVSPAGDYIGRLLMNLRGYSKLAIVATTLTSEKTVYVDAALCHNSHSFLKA